MTRPADLERRVLLAIEGTRRVPSPDGHDVLRDAVATMALRTAVMEHGGAVNDLALSADGRLATASDDKTVRVWDMTGRELARMAHDNLVNAVAFGPDGRLLASVSRDRTARLWDASSGRELVRAAHEGWVQTIAFSPDGRRFATGGLDRTARIWETVTGRLLAGLPHGDVLNRVVFSPDGRWLATASGSPAVHMQLARGRSDVKPDDSARVWDVASGREIVRLRHAHNVQDVQFSPDGQLLLTGGRDGTARLWEVPSGRLRHQFQHESSVETVAISPDGRYLATGSGAFFFSGTSRTARVWDTGSGREVARFVHADDVRAVAFTADGAHVATGSGDGAARLWSIATGGEVLRMALPGENTVKNVVIAPDGRTFATAHSSGLAAIWRTPEHPARVRLDHAGLVRDVAFAAEGRTLLSVGDDAVAIAANLENGSNRRVLLGADVVPHLSAVARGQYVATVTATGVRVQEVASGRELLLTPPDARVVRLAFSRDGRWLAAVLGDHRVAVWRVETGALAGELQHDEAPVNLWFDDAGRRLAVASAGGGLQVWDPERRAVVARLSHGGKVQDVQFSRDGRRLVARSEERVVRVWDIDAVQELSRRASPTQVKAIALSADGGSAASGSGDAVVVWEASTGREITRFTHAGGTTSLAFDPEGAHLASGGFYDRAAHVWEVRTGREILVLRFPVAVERVLFSPDGRRLGIVTGTALLREHHTVHAWTWRPADLVADACTRVTRNLRLDEWDERIGGPYQATCPDAADHPVEMLRQADTLASAGDPRRAGRAFAEAVRATLGRRDAALGNAVCWYGSLGGFARVVLPACDHAVRLAGEAERGAYADSRGVARALSGDRRGAIADLDAGLAWLRATGAPKAMIARRESWLAALRAGRHPFDAETLESLRKEE